MIKTVIFDIGDVLVRADWLEFCMEKGVSEEMAKRIVNATFKGGYWKEFDRGVWSEEKILKHFIDMDPGIEPDLKRIWENIKGFCKKQDYAVPWIKELKRRGLKVLVLSNLPEKVHRECIDAMEFLEIVDGGILSYEDKLIKPDKEIYQLLIERYHLIPEESVFLDDRSENIEAALKEGIRGIHVIDYEQAHEELERVIKFA